MPKFSIIIPVYNVEDYIKKCLDSVFNQTYKDFEVIVVNDGTKDNSMDIVKNYDVKIINQENSGLSEARNTGVKNAKGEYLVFLDSDDFIEKDLLKEINKSLKNKPDVVRYQIQDFKNNEVTEKYEEEPFDNLDGIKAFEKICKYHYIENAWAYAINREYYNKEKFSFKKNTYHEDFGLTPLIIIKAKKVNSINYVGYNYVQREGSIMNNKDYQKTKKKVDDFYNHYKFLKEEGKKTKLDTKYFNSFISNCLILKITELNNNDYKKYKKKLKEEKVFDDILCDTLARKIKKVLIKISPKIYYKIMRG